MMMNYPDNTDVILHVWVEGDRTSQSIKCTNQFYVRPTWAELLCMWDKDEARRSKIATGA